MTHMRRWMAATAVAAVLGMAACSAAPKTVSIRQASDAGPVPEETTTTVEPTATTVAPVDDPTPTTAPTATTAPVTTSPTTAAVTPTTAQVTATTVQPVTATTTAPVTVTTAVTPTTVALRQVPSLVIDFILPGVGHSCAAELFTYGLDLPALRAAVNADSVAVPDALIVDRRGTTLALASPSQDLAQRAANECASAAGGPFEPTLTVPADSMGLAQAVKAQLDGLGLKNLKPMALIAA